MRERAVCSRQDFQSKRSHWSRQKRSVPIFWIGAPPTFTSRRLLGPISLTALVRQDSDISHLWPSWPKAVRAILLASAMLLREECKSRILNSNLLELIEVG